MSLPANWQTKITESLTEMRKDTPGAAVFGVSLPIDWKSSLAVYARRGELRKLFRVKAVSFEGDTITRLDPPQTGKDAGSPEA